MNIRISNKENVQQNGRKTACTIHRFNDDAQAYLYDGIYYVPNWDATDEEITNFVWADDCYEERNEDAAFYAGEQ